MKLMHMFETKIQAQKKEIALHDVATQNDKDAYTRDKNNDGIADFLQRSDIPSMVKTVSDTVLAHVDAQKELEQMMMGWAGYIYNDRKSLFESKLPPMMSIEGVIKLGQYLKSVINKLTMNSNIDQEWCHLQTEAHSITIVEWLADNKSRWGISSSDLTPVSEQCDSFIFLILSRSINDRQREHDTKRMQLTGEVKPQQQSAI